MECAIPWQSFEPSKCQFGQKQQNKRYPTAEYISVSYKDSMVEMPSFQIVSPWLAKPNSCTTSEIIEIGWCVSEHPFFQKLKMLHDHMKTNLLNNHKIKLNSNPYLLSIYLDKTKTVVRDLNKNAEILLTDDILLNPVQQYKLCIRLAGIHVQHGSANYRFKCVGILLR
jgi:hypothetical protein